nr:TPA_inf: venom-related protein Kazal protease inhibitor [Conus ebraeus]
MKTAVCVFLTVLALAHGDVEDICNQACTMESDPHCLTFQKTVPNECMGEVEICRMRAQGFVKTDTRNKTCECAIGCTMNYDPVCSRDLDTNETKEYGNACALRAECEPKRLVKVDLDECD